MKASTITICCFLFVACGSAPKPVIDNSMTADNLSANKRPQTAIAHSLENQIPTTGAPSGEKSKWTQSGDAIDTKKFDTAIAAAEMALRKSPNDTKAKKALAEAYLDRANALTSARQYASALGDYRRTVKYDPSNEEAK